MAAQWPSKERGLPKYLCHRRATSADSRALAMPNANRDPPKWKKSVKPLPYRKCPPPRLATAATFALLANSTILAVRWKAPRSLIGSEASMS